MNNFYRYPYYRSNDPPPPPALNPLPPKPINNCHNKKKAPQKKKFNFKSFRKDTCTSLNDVEHFLCNFSTFIKYIKLIKLLK